MKEKLAQYLPSLNADLKVILLLFIFWGLGIFVVGPSGDFPLNDDWAYARGVYSLVEEGQLVLDTWPAMTLIAQIGIGTAYCELFGLSFETLRWSTLINSFLCICFFYFLLRKFVDIRVAFFVSLLLFFNPLFFSLSFTFMTEIHFLMALTGALLFLSKYIESSKYSFLLWGGVFSIIATLIRQPGLLAPLSFGIILLFREKTMWRRIAAFLPFLASFLCLKIYYYWLGTEYPDNFRVGGFMDLIHSLLTKEPEVFIKRIVNLFLYAGLFLFPLTILLLPNLNWKTLKNKVFGLAVVLPMSILLAVYLDVFPAGNMFYNLGLGPKLLKGVAFSHDNAYPRLSNDLWKILDYISLLGAIGMMLLLVQLKELGVKVLFTEKNISHKALIKWSVVLFCCFYFLVTVLTSSFFDRYSLPLIPCLGLLILPESIRFAKKYTVFAILCLMGGSLFSIAATHDYLSWNRARKEAYNYLNEEQRIPPTFIDAGFEINGWLKAGPDRFNKASLISWWFVTEDDYVLAFDELKGFKKFKAYPFQTLLPIETDSLLILKKDYIFDFDYSEFPISSDLETRDSSENKFNSTHSEVQFSNGSLQSKERSKSGQYAVKLTPNDRFGLSTKFWSFYPEDRVVVSVWRYPAGSKAGIIIDSEYKNLFYIHETENVINVDDNGWEQIQAEVTIPPFIGKDRVGVHILNFNNEEVWLDDFHVDRSPKE